MTAKMSANSPDEVFKPFVEGDETENDSTKGRQDLEEFDPFQIGASSPNQKKKAKPSKKSSDEKAVSKATPMPSRTSAALPPRMDVKLKIHEEVSSTADTSSENEGSSMIFVEGTVQAQVTSSDALKNSPFILVADNHGVNINANTTYAKNYASQGQTSQINVIKIPKSIVGFVTAGKFQVREEVTHMPMLLERKITRSKARIQVAIQVRSKLSNPEDMKSLSIALSVSDKIAGDTIEINVGKGDWNRVTRTIVWTLDQLPQGESFMVSARAKLKEGSESIETSELGLPVIMRCESNYQISSASFQAIEASGYPATVSYSTIQASSRIVHRLN